MAKFTVILILIIVLHSLQMCNSVKWISRQNYGVLFEDVGLIDFGKSNWYHTFVVPLTTVNIYKYKNPCVDYPDEFVQSEGPYIKRIYHNITIAAREPYGYINVPISNEISLKSFCPSFVVFERHHNFLRRSITKLRQRVNVLLPRKSSPRVKRGLFDFVGKVSKSLFGTATTDDVNALASQINYMYGQTIDVKGRLIYLGNELHSYMTKNNHEDELLQYAISLQHRETNLMFNTLSASTRNLSTSLVFWINVLNVFGTDFSIYLRHLYEIAQKELIGVESLLQGKLPPELVEPDILAESLKTIQSKLSNFSNYRVSHLHPSFYYNRRDVTFVRYKNNIHITIRVPIHSGPTTYKLYRIHAIPMPVPGQKNLFTVLQTPKPYFAINEDETLYLTITSADFSTCTGSTFKQCYHLTTTISTSRKSCELALFLDETSQISNICTDKFQIIQNYHTYIAKLGEHFLLSTPDDNIVQKCSDTESPINISCTFCLIKLPCGCVIEGDSLYIPPRISDCENNSTVWVNHSVNLPLLHEFYSEYTYLFNITSTQTYNLPVIAEIPQINLLNNEFDGVTQTAQTLRLNLRKTAKRLKNNNEIFKDKVSQMTLRPPTLFSYSFQVFIIVLLTITTISAHVSLLFSIKNYLVLISLLHAAEAAPLKITPPSNLLDNNFSLEEGIHSILTVTALIFCGLLLLLLMFLLWLLIQFYFKSGTNIPPNDLPFNTTIYVIFYFANDCVAIPLLVSCVDGKDLAVTQMKPFAHNCVKFEFRLLYGSLIFDWSALKLLDKQSKSVIELPPKVFVKSLESARLRSINKGPVVIKLIGKQHGNYFELFKYETPSVTGDAPLKCFDNKALFTSEGDE